MRFAHRNLSPASTPGRRFVAFAALLALVVCSGCQTTVWDEHDGHRWCRPALRDAPGAPDLDCDALHMCANEVTLNGADAERFAAAMARLGCDPP